jgi:methionyl-tRNA synthetase
VSREENYFFKLSEFEQRLIDHYEAHPEAVQPVTGATKCSASSGRASPTSREPQVGDVGSRCRGTCRKRRTCGSTLFNYCSAIGYASDPERFNRYWPATITSSAKTSSRFHAVYWPAMLMAAGLEPPKWCSRTGGSSSAAKDARSDT